MSLRGDVTRRPAAAVVAMLLTGSLAACAADVGGSGARVPVATGAASEATPSGSASAAGSPGAAGPPAATGSQAPGRTDAAGAEREARPQPAGLVLPAAATTVLPTEAADDLAVSASALVFESAPLVVLAPMDDLPAQERAARAAVAAGMPLLLTPPPVPAPSAAPSSGPAAGSQATELEVRRLGASAALVFGAVPDGFAGVTTVRAPDSDDAVARLLGVPVVPDAQGAAVPSADPVVAAAGYVPGALVVPADPGLPPVAGPGAAGASPSSGASVPASLYVSPSTQTRRPASGARALPSVSPGRAPGAVRVLSTGQATQLAAVATTRAAGADVLVVPGGDPRAAGSTVQAIAATPADRTVALGSAFGDVATVERRVATAATGVELPGGGQLVLPGPTYVALYGSPITASLGVLGEQGPEATVRRAQEHASWYAGLTGTPVVPTLEVIATVASGGPGRDGNYSTEWPVEDLRPLVDLARQNGLYVVLDLQPGRSDFLTQAQRYEELLREPHVGLALDPEWRLAPDQLHLRQIGQVGVAEVNSVVNWLADLTRDNALPQKLLVLHQFQVRTITGSAAVDQSRSEVAVLVHVDGQGSQPAKQDTWQVLHRNAPGIRYWGWKNFYDEDRPMLTPEQTMQVQPFPQLITYQ